MIFLFLCFDFGRFPFFYCFFCLAFFQSITSAAKTISKSKIHHSMPDLSLRPVFCPFLLVFGTTSCAFFRISMEAKLLDCFTWTPKMQLALFSVLFFCIFLRFLFAAYFCLKGPCCRLVWYPRLGNVRLALVNNLRQGFIAAAASTAPLPALPA